MTPAHRDLVDALDHLADQLADALEYALRLSPMTPPPGTRARWRALLEVHKLHRSRHPRAHDTTPLTPDQAQLLEQFVEDMRALALRHRDRGHGRAVAFADMVEVLTHYQEAHAATVAALQDAAQAPPPGDQPGTILDHFLRTRPLADDTPILGRFGTVSPQAARLRTATPVVGTLAPHQVLPLDADGIEDTTAPPPVVINVHQRAQVDRVLVDTQVSGGAVVGAVAAGDDQTLPEELCAADCLARLPQHVRQHQQGGYLASVCTCGAQGRNAARRQSAG